MNSEEITFVLCSIDKLTSENQEFQARLKAVERNAQAWSNCSAIAARNSVANKQTTDKDDGTVEPLTNKRLNDVRQEVCAIKTTWADLRQLYPPRQSGFAPLAEADDDNLEIDDAFSQAATMAAYGVELLRIALGNPRVNRRLTRQAYRLLATLCATLIGTRDRHRSAAKVAEEESSVICSARDTGAATPKLSRHTGRGEQTEGLCTNKRTGPDYLDSSESDSSSSSLWQERRRHVRRKKRSKQSISKPLAQGPVPVTPAPDLLCADHKPSIDAISAVDMAAAAGESELVVSHGRVNQLRRRIVIRNALLRQGQSESAVITYFNQWTEGTSRTYDGEWSNWAN
ncbi:hypothetical protein GGI08_003656, partial [Coemansia sp. S2]